MASFADNTAIPSTDSNPLRILKSAISLKPTKVVV